MATKSKTALKFVFYSLIIASIILCPLSFAWFYNWDGPTKDAGQNRAAVLIETLDTYRKQHGIYPAELQELVPIYLVTVPRPSWRQDYLYMTNNDRSRFSINFEEKGEAPGDGFCGYQSVTAKWKCTDSYPTYP